MNGSVRLLWLVTVLTALGVASAAYAQMASGGLFGGGGTEENLVSLTGQFTAAGAGQPAKLLLTATIKDGWYIYSITQAAGGPVTSRIKLDPSQQFRVTGDFQTLTPPEKHAEPVFDNLTIEKHHKVASWSAPIELAAGVDPAQLKITGRLFAQVCDPNNCFPPRDFPFTASLAPDAAAPSAVLPVATTGVKPAGAATVLAKPADQVRTISVEQQAGGSDLRALTVVVPSAQSATFNPGALVVEENEDIQHTSTALAMAMGFLGGLILNLMPCVLPVIGLKILSFIEQSGQSRQQTLKLNLWYSLGLLAVFVLLASLAVFAGLGWGQLFHFVGFNIALAAVIFVMGLSFLGVWEIPIPGFVGRGKTLELSQREGAAGAFAKGVLTTVLATPCSAPFLATTLTWAVVQPWPKTYAVFIAMGLGMASPYLLIGAFPRLIRFLPKPGQWMETFQQVMGFVLMGTVVFLLTFMDLTYVVPTVALLFGLWAACWWIGRMPVTADTAAKTRRWLEAIALVGAVWLIAFPGLDKIIPSRFAFGLHGKMQEYFQQAVEQAIAQQNLRAGVAPGTPGAGKAAETTSQYALPWKPFTRNALETTLAAQHSVLVDFTANWCLTCKTLEAAVLNTAEVRQAIDANGVITLRADWTQPRPEVTEMLELLGSKQVPVLAIFPAADPNHPIVLRGGYTRQTVLEALNKAGTAKTKL
jgi:suppressor for copper-sensitivity B